MSCQTFLVLGLNPAYQRTLTFGRPLALDGVNRAIGSVRTSVGGKGQQCALAAAKYQKDDVKDIILCQFLAGQTGRAVEGMIVDAAGPASLKPCNVWVDGDSGANTRTCTTLLHPPNNQATEIIDPPTTMEVSGVYVNQMKEELASLFRNGSWSSSNAIALCGTVPAGVSPDFYSQFLTDHIARLDPQDRPVVVLDAYRPVDSIVRCLNTGCVTMLKINRHEYTQLREDGGARAALQQVKYVAVTDGGKPASIIIDGAREESFAIQVDRSMEQEGGQVQGNPIGCGDVCTAVTAVQLAGHGDARKAFREGLVTATRQATGYPSTIVSTST